MVAETYLELRECYQYDSLTADSYRTPMVVDLKILRATWVVKSSVPLCASGPLGANGPDIRLPNMPLSGTKSATPPHPFHPSFSLICPSQLLPPLPLTHLF